VKVKITLTVEREIEFDVSGETEHGQDASALGQLVADIKKSVLDDPLLFIDVGTDEGKFTVTVEEP
jgi:hypothetical protein